METAAKFQLWLLLKSWNICGVCLLATNILCHHRWSTRWRCAFTILQWYSPCLFPGGNCRRIFRLLFMRMKLNKRCAWSQSQSDPFHFWSTAPIYCRVTHPRSRFLLPVSGFRLFFHSNTVFPTVVLVYRIYIFGSKIRKMAFLHGSPKEFGDDLDL